MRAEAALDGRYHEQLLGDVVTEKRRHQIACVRKNEVCSAAPILITDHTDYLFFFYRHPRPSLS